MLSPVAMAARSQRKHTIKNATAVVSTLIVTWHTLCIPGTCFLGPVGTLVEVLHGGDWDCRGTSAEDHDQITHTSQLQH